MPPSTGVLHLLPVQEHTLFGLALAKRFENDGKVRRIFGFWKLQICFFWEEGSWIFAQYHFWGVVKWDLFTFKIKAICFRNMNKGLVIVVTSRSAAALSTQLPPWLAGKSIEGVSEVPGHLSLQTNSLQNLYHEHFPNAKYERKEIDMNRLQSTQTPYWICFPLHGIDIMANITQLVHTIFSPLSVSLVWIAAHTGVSIWQSTWVLRVFV